MDINKVKQSMTVKYKGKEAKVITVIRFDNAAWIKCNGETFRVLVGDLKQLNPEPKLDSILGDAEERVCFQRAFAEAKEAEDGKPINHNREYTYEEVKALFTQFSNLVTPSGHITDLKCWIEKCSQLGKEMGRTTIAISTEASRIHFYMCNPSPTIKHLLDQFGLERVRPARKTSRILRYMVHNWQ